MIEVFKTNILDRHEANLLLSAIHESFGSYMANFDLEDCDHILRVKSENGSIDSWQLVEFLKKMDCQAEVLGEEPGPGEQFLLRMLRDPQYVN